MIRADEKLVRILESDPALIEVLQALSPALHGLRSPDVRKVMSSLMTVEQAARTAGLDTEELVARLERAVADGERGEDADGAPYQGERSVNPTMPPELAAIPEDRIIELDVRDDLRAGREPFSRIMSARAQVPDGGALSLRAIFEPIPLYGVLGSQGFEHYSIQHADDDWQVWFFRAREGADAGGSEAAVVDPGSLPMDSADPESGEDDVIILDVRGLDPPEPMARTLAALEVLPPDATLLHINLRVPRFLLPQLEDRGFTYDVREQEAGLVRVFIRRAQSPDRSQR